MYIYCRDNKSCNLISTTKLNYDFNPCAYSAKYQYMYKYYFYINIYY